MRIIAQTVFVLASVLAAANFAYAWTHPDATSMEVLRRTPENLGEMHVGLLMATIVGAVMFGRITGRRDLRKQAAALATFGLPEPPDFIDEDFSPDTETQELIDAAKSWNDRRTDPFGQDNRLATAVKNFRLRWGQ